MIDKCGQCGETKPLFKLVEKGQIIGEFCQHCTEKRIRKKLKWDS